MAPKQTPELRAQTDRLLTAVETELQALELWEESPPASHKLQSTEPFATDTLAFHQWLQFIMIPGLKHRVKQQQHLPTQIAVSPMAIQVYRGELRRHRQLIQRLKELDILLSGENPLQGET